MLGTNGLVSYWRMDDTSGTTLIDAIGNNNATAVGGPTLGAPGAISNDPDLFFRDPDGNLLEVYAEI